MRTIQATVERCILLNKGGIEADGAPASVIAKYYLAGDAGGRDIPKSTNPSECRKPLQLVNWYPSWETGDVTIEEVWLEDRGRRAKSSFHYQEENL